MSDRPVSLFLFVSPTLSRFFLLGFETIAAPSVREDDLGEISIIGPVIQCLLGCFSLVLATEEG